MRDNDTDLSVQSLHNSVSQTAAYKRCHCVCSLLWPVWRKRPVMQALQRLELLWEPTMETGGGGWGGEEGRAWGAGWLGSASFTGNASAFWKRAQRCRIRRKPAAVIAKQWNDWIWLKTHPHTYTHIHTHTKAWMYKKHCCNKSNHVTIEVSRKTLSAINQSAHSLIPTFLSIHSNMVYEIFMSLRDTQKHDPRCAVGRREWHSIKTSQALTA